jgi:predicted O-linked N-acetylglucosamine transferase (SPINDLY family)
MLNHLAVTLAEHGKSREAEELLRARLQTDPLNPQTQNNLATLLIQAKRLDEARQILEETVQLEPANTRAWSNLAIALAEDHADLAVQAATQATLLEPESAEVWVLLGNIQCKHQNAKESLIAYERAFAIAPESLDENNNFGLVLNTSNRLETALEFYQRRLTKDPSDPIAHADIAISYLNSGQLGPAISHLNQSIELDPTNEYAHSNLLLVQTYSPDFPAERQLSESKKWAKAHASAIPAMPISIRPRGEKLRIGYLSADFHEHPAGRFLNALLPQHDRSRFEITIYANQLAADEVTLAIVKSADRWRIVKKMDDATLAKRIRDDGIDILVDLLGHTPNHRLKAFALKPAPVQVTWLGYFGTTGMSQMDYILADKWVLPPDLEPCFSEAPARMDGCLYLFQPPSIDAEVGPSPFATTGRVTYGCFNNTAKITPEVVRLWSRVLLAQPESRMLLNRWPYEWPSVRDRYLNHFKSAGIDPSRIEFRWTSGPEAYFRSHHEVDIMLDSIPFGGGTTSMEALWMGVPVVSMSTDRFAGRMTESILNAVGLSEMVSRSESEYIALACDLAQDPDRLKALRSRLRTQVENSSLCDLPAYTRRLEATFDRIWEQKAAPQAA